MAVYYVTCTKKDLYLPGTVPFNMTAVRLLTSVPDKHIKVKVNGGDKSQPVPLNFGDTLVEILVCSADGTSSQVSWIDLVKLMSGTGLLLLYLF